MDQVLLLGSASNFYADFLDVAQESQPENSFLGVDNSNLALREAITRVLGVSHALPAKQLFLSVPGNPSARKSIAIEAQEIGLEAAPPIIHPSASLSRSLLIGKGGLIGRLVSGGSGVVIGSHCQVNRSASLGHHCVIEDFVTISPAAILLGGASIKRGTFIGAGSVVLPGITVGANATVGAGAIVTKSVRDGATVVGNPARETP